MHKKYFVWAIVGIISIFACEGAEDETSPKGSAGERVEVTESPSESPSERPPENSAPIDEPTGPVADDPRFELKVSANAPYHVDTLGSFAVTVRTKNGWHVNQDYPVRVTVSGSPDIRLTKSDLERGDAAEFDEEHAHFEVPVTPTRSGEHRCTATVDFAVCTDEACIPVQRTVTTSLAVD